jgi:hypothetical protein
MQSIKQLCTKAMLLDKGKIKYIGEAEFVTDQYLSRNIKAQTESHFDGSHNKQAYFLEVEIRDLGDKKVDILGLDQPWTLHLKYRVNKPCDRTLVAVEVLTLDGIPIYMSADTDTLGKLTTKEPGTYTAKVDFAGINFSPGMYYLRVSIQSPGKEMYDIKENFLLRIRQDPKDIRSKYFDGKYMGYLSNKISWEISKH